MTKEKMTFEKALEKLERIVAEIEEGKVSLEESIEKYAEGTKLIDTGRGILDKAESKIKLLARSEGQTLTRNGELEGASAESE